MKSYDCDPLTLSAAERIDAVVDAERDVARVQARQVRLIAAIAADPCTDAVAPGLDKEYFIEDLRAALGESGVSVGCRVELARELTGRLCGTLTELEAGALTLRHARLLTEAVIPLPDADAVDVQAAVLPFAAGRDLAAFGRKVRREVLKRDTRSVEDQVAAALADRRVWARPVYPCLTQVGALLPADGAQLLMTALEALADRNGADDARSKDQQRADALVQLAVDALNGYASCPTCVTRPDNSDEPGRGSSCATGVISDDTSQRSSLPRWQGARPTIQVTVALSTLLGLDTEPGELDDYGPVPASLAVRWASQEGATWRRLVTDDLGHLIDYGRTTYRPPADLSNFVLTRDRTCRFPTCNRRACRCELDHQQAWNDGGATNHDNLVALCRRHHHGKHEAGWNMTRLDDGSIKWTSPTGHLYLVPASTYPIDSTHDRYIPHDNGERPTGEAEPEPDDQRSAEPPF